MRSKTAMKTKIFTGLLLIYLSVMSIYFYTHQYYNADIEAYMGLVYKMNEPEMNINEIHKKVFGELQVRNPNVFTKSENSAETETAGANSYYFTLSKNVKAYEEELEFFTVKPLYNVINSVFYKLGASASASTFLISIISYFSIIFLMFLFLNDQVKKTELAFVLTILISLFKPLLDSARHATPDMLACLLLLLAVYFFVYKKSILLTTIFSMLTIFTRPEYFIFFTFLLLLIVIFRKSFPYKISQVAICYTFLSLSFIIIQLYSKISWSVLFMNQFTKVQFYPISNPDAFILNDYINFIKKKIFLEFNSSYFVILMIFSIIIFGKALYDKRKKGANALLAFSFILTIYISVFVRFLSFPILVNRMMIGFYLLIILSIISFQFSSRKNTNH